MAALGAHDAMTFDWTKFNTAYGQVLQTHKALVKTGRNCAPAEAAAQALASAVDELRISIFHSEELTTVKEFLGKEESLFPVALIMSQLVSHDMLSCFDQLKLRLSYCTQNIMNIAAYQCTMEQRRLPLETAETIRTNLRKIIKPLRFEDCEIEFHLKCAHAAARTLDVDKGRWRSLFVRHRGDLAKGALQTMFGASPLPPYVSIAPMVSPAMDFFNDVFHTMKEEWYQHVWNLMFERERNALTDLAAWRGMTTYILKHHVDYKLYFYFTVLFNKMMNEGISPLIRNEIIYGDGISLKTLIKPIRHIVETGSERNTSKFARVRYNALRVLAPFRYPGTSQWILERSLREKRPEVKELAKSYVKNRGKINDLLPLEEVPLPPIAQEGHEPGIPVPAGPEELEQAISEAVPEVNQELAKLSDIGLSLEQQIEESNRWSAEFDGGWSGYAANAPNSEQQRKLKADLEKQKEELADQIREAKENLEYLKGLVSS